MRLGEGQTAVDTPRRGGDQPQAVQRKKHEMEL